MIVDTTSARFRQTVAGCHTDLAAIQSSTVICRSNDRSAQKCRMNTGPRKKVAIFRGFRTVYWRLFTYTENGQRLQIAMPSIESYCTLCEEKQTVHDGPSLKTNIRVLLLLAIYRTSKSLQKAGNPTTTFSLPSLQIILHTQTDRRTRSY